MEGHATSTTGSASAATSTGGTSTGSVTSVTSPSSTDAIIQVGLTVQNLMYTQDFHIVYIYKDGTCPVLQCLIAWMKCGVSGIEEKRTIRYCPPSAGWCYFSHQYGASAHYKPIDYLPSSLRKSWIWRPSKSDNVIHYFSCELHGLLMLSGFQASSLTLSLQGNMEASRTNIYSCGG